MEISSEEMLEALIIHVFGTRGDIPVIRVMAFIEHESHSIPYHE